MTNLIIARISSIMGTVGKTFLWALRKPSLTGGRIILTGSSSAALRPLQSLIVRAIVRCSPLSWTWFIFFLEAHASLLLSQRKIFLCEGLYNTCCMSFVVAVDTLGTSANIQYSATFSLSSWSSPVLQSYPGPLNCEPRTR
jgi:hypothetical protein